MLARTTNHQIPKNWKWERILKHHYNFLFGTDYLFPPLPDLVILSYVKDCGYKGAGNKGLQPQHWRSPDTNTTHPVLLACFSAAAEGMASWTHCKRSSAKGPISFRSLII